MFHRTANLAIRRARAVLIVSFLLLIGAGGFGASVEKHLGAGGFIPLAAESMKANDYISQHFSGGDTNFVVAITAEDLHSEAATKRAADVAAKTRNSQFASAVTSYWETNSPALISNDGKTGLVVARVSGDDASAPARANYIAQQFTDTHDGVKVKVGGQALVFYEVNDTIKKDLLLAEAIAIPLTAVVLVWVFGSLLAALLPLAVGGFAIVSTLAILRGFTYFTDVSVYALNMTTAMGLALAIDYSLFMVSRFREELHHGRTVDEAIHRTVSTAGRTVLFSSATVALALAALVVFPVYFLKSFAYTGIAVVAMAAVASLVILPATLKLLGTRVNQYDVAAWVRGKLGRPTTHAEGPVTQAFWYRVSKFSMRHAALVTIVVVAALVGLGSPFAKIAFGYPDDRIVTEQAQTRQVGDLLRTQFSNNPATSLAVVVPHFSETAQVADYAQRLSLVPHVTKVLASTGIYDHGQRLDMLAPPTYTNSAGSLFQLTTDVDPFGDDGRNQVTTLRDLKVSDDASVTSLVTGPAAANVDALASLESRLWLAVLLIVVTAFIALYLFTGSVIMPLKALVLNILSLSAMFGALVWIFQEGHLSSWLGFTATGTLVPNMPLLMFCLAFGMSMDYEVFLLSRVREEWLKSDRSAEANRESVALGAARTGRIITAAALLMAIVFFSMVISRVSMMQLFGLGMTLVILTDATIIRGVLVPALMRLMGRLNWWAPKPLAALHEKIGLREEVDVVAAPTSRETVSAAV